jgi:hypothetical protein
MASIKLASFCAAVLVNELDLDDRSVLRRLSRLNWVRFGIRNAALQIQSIVQGLPPSPLSLSQPEANASRLIILHEQDSGIFECCLNSHYRRNVARYRPITFFDALDCGCANARGL